MCDDLQLYKYVCLIAYKNAIHHLCSQYKIRYQDCRTYIYFQDTCFNTMYFNIYDNIYLFFLAVVCNNLYRVFAKYLDKLY